jgi:ribosomal protein S18 acetylase RimI-like enzyme
VRQELVLLAAAAWPALEEVRAGGWLLRAAAGVTSRANSALPLGPPTVPLDDLLGAVEDWYDARLLPPRIQVSDPELDGELAARGWAAESETEVLVGPLPAGDASGVQLDGEPDEAWLACWWAVSPRGGPAERDVAEQVMRGTPAAYASLLVDGEVAAVARGVRQGTWLGLFAVAVLPAQQRQGHASRVMAALGGWAGEQGAERTYLQVGAGNLAAQGLYDGMTSAYSYRYRTTVRA